MVEDKDKMVVKSTTPMGVSSVPHDHEHERTDVNIRALLISLGALVVVGIVVHLATWLLFEVYEDKAALGDRPASPVADRNPVPPQPRLQPSPPQNMTELEEMTIMRKQNDTVLHSYGWVDKPAGIARMPIDSAMARIAAGQGGAGLGKGEIRTSAQRPDTITGGPGHGPTDSISLRMPGGRLERK